MRSEISRYVHASLLSVGELSKLQVLSEEGVSAQYNIPRSVAVVLCEEDRLDWDACSDSFLVCQDDLETVRRRAAEILNVSYEAAPKVKPIPAREVLDVEDELLDPLRVLRELLGDMRFNTDGRGDL